MDVKSLFTRANRYSFRTSDITFQVGEFSIKAHRVVLSARSHYFRTLFRGGFAESYMSTVPVEDVEADVFECMLRFLYTAARVLVTENNVVKLIRLANRYAIPELVECCEVVLSSVGSHSLS